LFVAGGWAYLNHALGAVPEMLKNKPSKKQVFSGFWARLENSGKTKQT
jgi:hypothetical protein